MAGIEGGEVQARQDAACEFDVYLIKPTRYDDEGYPLQWWRSLVPSNSLACVYGIAQESVERGLPAPGVTTNIFAFDEINTRISVRDIIARAAKSGRRTLVCLVGVQTNQFPRAMDLARPFRAAGIQVCIGGFHVSGCISMLAELPDDIREAQDLGISVFTGEAEDQRLDEVLLDAWNDRIKPVYNHVNDMPNIAGAPLPSVPAEQVSKNVNRYSSFDLGRGCPFECSFCTIINVQGRKSRFRTADDLEAIVRESAAQGVNRFFLTDDNFARNKAWRSFTDRLIKLRDEGFPVRLVIQVDTLAHRIDGFIDSCVEAGADQIFIGLENINASNLELVKKRQNRIEEYREMFLAWKAHPVFITCGYIVGFPADSRESILRDIEILKAELPIDTLYLNYLTPLPGSEDHRSLYKAGEWMDPDMNKYDLNHRVTRHASMSDDEWESAYRDAHRSFYSWDHMRTIIRRMVALRSNKKLTTVNRLLMYREAVRLDGVSALEAGYFRIRRRRQRRSGMPIESFWTFYSRYGWNAVTTTYQLAATYIRLRGILREALRDPKRYEYSDRAIAPVETTNEEDVFVQAAMASSASRKRMEARKKRAVS